MIKVFQAEVFEKFLEGKTLEECYAAVGKVANDYMDLLYNKGSKLPDEELLDLISERYGVTIHFTAPTSLTPFFV
jgi:DNA polymerase epsilon subunit 1